MYTVFGVDCYGYRNVCVYLGTGSGSGPETDTKKALTPHWCKEQICGGSRCAYAPVFTAFCSNLKSIIIHCNSFWYSAGEKKTSTVCRWSVGSMNNVLNLSWAVLIWSICLFSGIVLSEPLQRSCVSGHGAWPWHRTPLCPGLYFWAKGAPMGYVCAYLGSSC